jgi:hypothetical protein
MSFSLTSQRNSQTLEDSGALKTALSCSQDNSRAAQHQYSRRWKLWKRVSMRDYDEIPSLKGH